jgi:hypothetical protein
MLWINSQHPTVNDRLTKGVLSAFDLHGKQAPGRPI